MRHKIWLIEPNRLFREGLRQILDDSRFQVTTQLPSMDAPLPPLASENYPDLVLVSLQAPLERHGAEFIALSALCDRWPTQAVVILVNDMSLDELKVAFQAGVRGYLTKDIAPVILRESLMLALLGESVFPGAITHMLFGSVPVRSSPPSTDLSKSERNILTHLARGAANKTIARELSLSEGTVKVHMKSIFRKIGAHNRTEAAIWATAGSID